VDERDWLAERFQAHRPHLRAVAYRMLGSLTEAEDAVQGAWLRLSRADTSEVHNLGGWLTTLVARECLDLLRARTSRREEPLGVHLPEPIISGRDGVDPEQQALLAEGVGLALLVVLDTLAPAERLAFVLHDMFAVPFDQIAPIVGRSPNAAKMLASRARRRVQSAAPLPDADLARQREVVDAFFAAAREGQLRRVGGGARPRRGGPRRWRRPGGHLGGARCGGRGRASARWRLLAACPHGATGTGERRRGRRLRRGGTAVCGRGLHG
jgi:RNA polymerase sigma factor (sigma-70 family)